MKKKVIAILLAALLVAGGYFTYTRLGDSAGTESKNVVYVSSVAALTDVSDRLGITNSYSGVTEAEKTWKVNKDNERTVKEIFVEAGQEVKKGDILFTYDTEEVETKIEEARLELERIRNERTGLTSNIEELEKERQKASGEQKTSLTLEIQERQLDLKKKDYEEQKKQNEIEKLSNSIDKSEVICEINGIIKSLNKDGSSSMMGDSDSDAFITVLSVGTYQVKGQINEQNLGRGDIYQDMPVLVQSRADESKLWKGVIERIDTENATQNNNNFYGGDNMNTSSSYPFYVKLESSEGLMLGQHVYIRPDFGQKEVTEREGIWLSEMFLDMDGDSVYVWADDGKGKLVRKPVVIGERDENTSELQILEGLTEEDCITWLEEGLEEGMPTVVSSDGSLGQSNPEMPEGMEDMDMIEESETEAQSEVE